MSERPSADHLKLGVEGLNRFLAEAFPMRPADVMGEVIEARPGFARMRRLTHEWDLRPGNLVSGPTQMGLVDSIGYVLVAAHFGPVQMAVTTHLNMQFLRPCQPGAIVADASLLKLGRQAGQYGRAGCGPTPNTGPSPTPPP